MKIKERKLLALLVGIVVGVVPCFFMEIATLSLFLSYTKYIIIGYFAGNSVVHGVTALKPKGDPGD